MGLLLAVIVDMHGFGSGDEATIAADAEQRVQGLKQLSMLSGPDVLHRDGTSADALAELNQRRLRVRVHSPKRQAIAQKLVVSTAGRPRWINSAVSLGLAEAVENESASWSFITVSVHQLVHQHCRDKQLADRAWMNCE